MTGQTLPTHSSVRAEAILARYPHTHPADLLAQICADERIAVSEADLRDIAGVLREQEGKWQIYLNRLDTPSRRRFTLAHLLGHYFLHATPGRTFVEGTLLRTHRSWRRDTRPARRLDREITHN